MPSWGTSRPSPRSSSTADTPTAPAARVVARFAATRAVAACAAAARVAATRAAVACAAARAAASRVAAPGSAAGWLRHGLPVLLAMLVLVATTVAVSAVTGEEAGAEASQSHADPDLSGPSVADPYATPNCPGANAAPAELPAGWSDNLAAAEAADGGARLYIEPNTADVPQDSCTYGATIVGNVYHDVNTNGDFDAHRGDRRLSGIEVRLVDTFTGQVLGQAITNQNGYFRFPSLPVGPVYRVEVVVPPGYRATTPTWREFESLDFSTFWCCTSRVDFGLVPDRAPTVPPPPPVPGARTPVPPPCCEIPTGRQIHLPILNFTAESNVCASIIEVQNVGGWPSKAMVVVWGNDGFCPPQCSGPLKVECSGLLAPGTAWNFLGAQLPAAAKSAMVFSAPALAEPGTGDVFADRLCQALFHDVVGNCDNFRRFKKAFNELGVWTTPSGVFDFHRYPGASLAVEVVRKCPGDVNPAVDVTGGYTGLADELLGAYDPVYGGYTFFAPLVVADRNGFTSWLYIQNGGIECSSVELWFRAQDDCLRGIICDIATLAPGETHSFDAAACVGPGWVGSAWVRGSQPLSIVADTVGRDLLTSYRGSPGELRYSHDSPAFFSAGSHVAFGPLLYSDYQGWDSLVQVQNLSSTHNAQVKVYFLDRGGNILATLVDWICPNGSQSFNLPVIATLPGNWTGSVRVESQAWFAPGSPQVAPPNITGVVNLIKYADVARSQPLEAMAYSLLPEHQVFDWQLGSGRGGLDSGVGRIGIPSFFKDRDNTGITTELAIHNAVPKPGFTDFVVYIYDQNGLVMDFCQKLGSAQVEYIDADAHLGVLPPGFKGSAVISAVFWEHHVFDGPVPVRNLVGLAAAKVERSGTVQGVDVPGDESAAMEGFPILGGFAFAGPPPLCPGLPGGGGGGGGGGGAPAPTRGAPTVAPTAAPGPGTALPPPPPPP